METKPQLLSEGRTYHVKVIVGLVSDSPRQIDLFWREKVVVLQKQFDCMAQNPQKVAVRNRVCFKIDHEKRTGLPKMSVRNAVYGNFAMVKVHASRSTARMRQRSVLCFSKSLSAHHSPIQIRSLKSQQIVNRFNAVFFSCHNF